MQIWEFVLNKKTDKELEEICFAKLNSKFAEKDDYDYRYIALKILIKRKINPCLTVH